MSILEQIQSLVRQFRNDLKAGNEPSIRSYLDRIDSSARRNLFENLLLCELEYFRRKQQSITSEDYVSRFPEFRSTIRQAFFESTMMSTDSSARTPNSAADTMTIGQPAARQLGQYELIRELGRGGFGVVYEARHVGRGNRVALKTLPTMQDGQSLSSRDAARLHRFRKEFRSLAEVNHPNLVGMQTLEVDGDRWFFTMDLIDGVDFLDHVRPNDELDISRLQQTLPQLVRGIIALHQLGIVHRDLKPSNVLVTPSGHLTILDFGLVAELQQCAGETLSMGTKQFAGTPRYAAPEQVSGERSAAVDWYALGTMLYEAITGQIPIQGSGIELMLKKQNESAESLFQHPTLPEGLTELARLVDEMLQREAGKRPSDEAVAGRLGVRLELTRFGSGSDNSAQSQALSSAAERELDGPLPETFGKDEESQLIGRASQLAQLHEIFSQFRVSKQPQVVIISGLSGEGKTALANTFLSTIRRKTDCLLLSGRCYDRESVPFKVIDSQIEPLARYLRSQPNDQLQQFLPPDIEMLSQLFPVLHSVPQISEKRMQRSFTVDDKEIRNRAFAALRTLLLRISERVPILFFVDDLQWGDTESAEVLLRVLEQPGAPRFIFLGTYRTDEAEDSRFLNAWDTYRDQHAIVVQTHHVSVSPLNFDQSIELVLKELHEDSPRVRERATELHEHSGGNAFLLLELLTCFDREADSFLAVPISEVIRQKLNRLPEGAESLLNVLAVAGQAAEASEIAAIAEHRETAISTLTKMRSERLVRFLGNEEGKRIDTYHDRIRESILQSMGDDQKRVLHDCFVNQIEQSHAGVSADFTKRFLEGNFDAEAIQHELDRISFRIFDLSFHASQASDSQRACIYSFLAAMQAARQFSLQVMVDLFAAARQRMEGLANQTQFQILLGLGDGLRLLGQYDQAESVLRDSLEKATEPLDRVEAEYLLAELARGAGRYEESVTLHANTLRSIDYRVPKLPLTIFLSLIPAVLRVALLCRQKKHTVQPAKASRRSMLIARLLEGLCSASWFRFAPLMAWANMHYFIHTSRMQVLTEINRAKTYMCVLVFALGFKRLGDKLYRDVKQDSPNDDLAMQVGCSLPAIGSCYLQGEYQRCINEWHFFKPIAMKSGDVWRRLIIDLHAALSDYRLGNLSKSLETMLQNFDESVRLGDSNTAHDYINAISMVTKGAFDFPTLMSMTKPCPENFQAVNQLLQGEARWHLYHCRISESYTAAEKAYHLIMKQLIVNHITCQTLVLRIEVQRALANELKATDSSAARRLLMEANFQAKKMHLLSWRNPVSHPAFLRQRGFLMLDLDRPKAALRFFLSSFKRAVKQGAQYEQALSRLALLRCQQQLGHAISSDQICIAEKEIEELEGPLAPLCQTHPLLLAYIPAKSVST